MTTTRKRVRCVIVDDHALLLDLLVGAVGRVPGVEVSATGTDIADAERLAAVRRIDLLIVDGQLGTGDGMHLVRRMRAEHPALKCIVIAGTTADFVCPPDLLDVVVSVIDKADASATLLAEVARVAGVPALDPAVTGSKTGISDRLTTREWEIFIAIGDGLSNKELATRFGLSPRTVETHRKAIARKLDVSGAALVRLAVLQRRTGAGATLADHPLSATCPPEGDE